MKRVKRQRIVAVLLIVLVAWRGAVEVAREQLLINVTESMPLGIYTRAPLGPLRRGQLVALSPPAPIATLVYTRRYIPTQAQLVKHIIAVEDDVWCATPEQGFTINGQRTGGVFVHDSQGALLPLWSPSCHRLAPGFVLVGSSAERSFDSRYFGPVPITTLTSEVAPLWLWTSLP